MYRIATVFELASVCPPPQGLSGAPQNYKFILYAQVKENAQSIVFTIRQIILLFRQIFQGLNHASVWRNDHIERYSEHLTVSTDIVVSEFDSMAKY